jgi:hypothetical protein
VAISINIDGYRQIRGIVQGAKEDKPAGGIREPSSNALPMPSSTNEILPLLQLQQVPTRFG